MPAKNLIFCFDGTGNEPGDANESLDRQGAVEDSSITNILKLQLLFGGDLEDGNAHGLNQLSLYYPGVGTYGSKVKRAFNFGLALPHLDVGRIIAAAQADLEQHYRRGDRIYVFGFSRGAAIARVFTSRIKPRQVTFLGVFDTVASIGIPDLDTGESPSSSDVVFEDHTVADNVKEALHLCSINDRRKAFEPTLMNHDQRITEVWFTGGHVDAGGGARRDGLSDVTLRFMLDEIERRGVAIETLAPTAIDYKGISASSPDCRLDLDDVMIEPNPLGTIHSQSRIWPLSALTLYDRRLLVYVNDRRSQRKPLVHHSVAERIYADPDYRPASLKGLRHDILAEDGSRQPADGLAQHLRVGMRTLASLKPGESRDVRVRAHLYHNRSGLLLEAGSNYSFKVKPRQKWRDGGVTCGAAGWDRDDVELGWIKELAIRGAEAMRRHPPSKWFCLIGAVGDDDNELFPIGSRETSHELRTSGEFCPFANDLKRRYDNNDGSIVVTVTRQRNA